MITAKDTLSLSISERISLVEDIWDTIVAESAHQTGLTDEEKRMITRRLESYHRNPDKVSEWNDVYNRIVKNK
ncbi:MAG: antitoxin [Desulfobacteraceae bacterium IS3]|nr:MAG: antitoxin [Desulfobacteraceae bacterium IS3]